MTYRILFRRLYWLVLATSAIGFLVARRLELLVGQPSSFDIVVLLIAAGLLLAPIFSEVQLWGLSLKRDLADTKAAIRQDLAELRLSMIQVAQQTVTQQLIVGPPPDASLPAVQERALRAASEIQGLAPAAQAPNQLASLPEQSVELMRIRYLIDREIRRIATGRHLPRVSGYEGRQSTFALTHQLESTGLISPGLGASIRDVYAVCSRAVHAEPVTPAQYEFARTAGPKLVDALWRLA